MGVCAMYCRIVLGQMGENAAPAPPRPFGGPMHPIMHQPLPGNAAHKRKSAPKPDRWLSLAEELPLALRKRDLRLDSLCYNGHSWPRCKCRASLCLAVRGVAK